MSNCTNSTSNSTACEKYQDSEFGIAFAVNVILFTLFLLWFLFWKKILPHVYEPMCDRNKAGDAAVARPPGGILGPFIAMFKISDEELEKKRGLDALMYLTFLKYLFWICASFTVYGFAVLAPVHWYASTSLSGLARLTMGNIPQSSPMLWADLVGVFVNTIFANIGLFLLYRRYTQLRSAYRLHHVKAENFVVMVRELQKGQNEESVRGVFERVFPGRVVSVHMAYNTKKLWDLLEKREAVGLKLEKAQARQMRNGKTPYFTDFEFLNCFCLFGKRLQDPVSFFRRRYDELTEEIRNLQRYKKFPISNVAFVMLKDRAAAQVACMSEGNFLDTRFVYPMQRTFTTNSAPSVNSVNWRWLHVGHLSRWIRSLLINFLTVIVIVFWYIPVTFVTGFANLNVLATVPGLGWVVGIFNVSPVVRSFVQGFLPSLAFVLLNFILYNIVLYYMCFLEFHWSLNIMYRGIFNKYFLFQVFNTLLGSVLASGVFQVLDQIIANPTAVVSLLATSLPGQWSFFTAIVMVNSLSTTDLASFGPVVASFWFRVFGLTKRDKRRAEELQTFDYVNAYANHMLTFLIATSYSTLAPFILPFCCLYFGVYALYHRYLIMYVYYPVIPSEGSIFPALYTRLCWSLIVYQALLGGVLGLQLFYAGAALFVLVVLQLCVWIWTDQTFHKLSKYGPISSTLDAEQEEKQHLQDEKANDNLHPHPDTYQYPTMRDEFSFEVEDQDPYITYNYPWPDCPEDLKVEWIKAEDLEASTTKVLRESNNDIEMTTPRVTTSSNDNTMTEIPLLPSV